MIHIFPTNRAVRAFYAAFTPQNRLLPKAISIAEFFNKALVVPGRVQAHEEMRLLLMQEASTFDAFEALHIPQQFMAFVRNASYLFGFFEELAAEEKTVEDLDGADAYAEFSEHLVLLSHVLRNYKVLLEEAGLYDRIVLPQLAQLDKAYLIACKEITFHLEGFLSHFEWRILHEMCAHIRVHVKLATTPYNEKMLTRFRAKGWELPLEHEIDLDLHAKTMRAVPFLPSTAPIITAAFALRSLQAGFVFDQIRRCLDAGMLPEEIVVVLPDERFASLLRVHDQAHLLNFAMGFPLEELKFVKRLRALQEALATPSQAAYHRLERLGIGQEEVSRWRMLWSKVVDFLTFETALGPYEEAPLPVQEKIASSLWKMQEVLTRHKGLAFFQAVGLFLRGLTQLNVDDVMGGPVTVMGVLETRGAKFKGVIIADFNDDVVPKRSEKDMFLSSRVRHHAALPDSADREQLQRYYYARLLQGASYKAISYVANEEKLPSRFLNAFTCKHVQYDARIHALVMPKGTGEKQEEADIVQEHFPFSYPLSASRLKSLLVCKRHYFYRYVQQISEFSLPSDALEAMEIGQAIHRAFELLYHKNTHVYTEASILYRDLCKTMEEAFGQQALWQLERDIWLERLERFCVFEAERFAQGWRPWHVEKTLETRFEGVMLTGKVDRIDKHERGGLAVVDYKTGTTLKSGPVGVERMMDFQMQFYYLLASTLGTVEEVGYGDLLQGTYAKETKMDERLAQLKAVLMEQRRITHFEKTDKRADCRYCPYVYMCQRA
jgi:RecB family exonuclease